MADVPAPRKKKLPPLSEQEAEQNGDAVKKVKKKKKKPPAEAAEDDQAAEGQKPTPRRRKTPASPAGEAEAPDDSKSKLASGDAPKKKKRTKPKAETTAAAGDEQVEEQPESVRSRATGDEDVTGSKASLLTKGSTGTPKKRVKKKKKKVPTDDDNFMNGTLAAELAELGEDVVEAEPTSERRPRVPHYAANPVLRSQATDKLYVEKNAGFKWMKKDEVAQMQMKPRQEELPPDAKKQTTMEFGLLTFKVFKAITLFVHGLTAGISFWQIILIYMLAFTSNLDLLVHYQPLGLPMQSLYYILLVLCCISTADRYDIASPSRDFILKALTLQNGAISLVIYMASLILSLSLMGLEDKMYLYQTNSTLWENPQTVSNDISLWKSLNVARGVTAIVAWLVLSIFPSDDRLTTNLTNSKDMEKDLEMNAVSMA